MIEIEVKFGAFIKDIISNEVIGQSCNLRISSLVNEILDTTLCMLLRNLSLAQKNINASEDDSRTFSRKPYH